MQAKPEDLHKILGAARLRRMDKNDVRLRAIRRVADVLIGLYEAPTEDDRDSVLDVGEMIVDALGLAVVSIDGTTALVTLDLPV